MASPFKIEGRFSKLYEFDIGEPGSVPKLVAENVAPEIGAAIARKRDIDKYLHLGLADGELYCYLNVGPDDAYGWELIVR